MLYNIHKEAITWKSFSNTLYTSALQLYIFRLQRPTETCMDFLKKKSNVDESAMASCK